MSLSKITTRIEKLIAMANNNPNEHEAAQAMERAFKLLAKHNLSMSDVERSEETCGTDSQSIKNGGPWARTIAFSIAKLYFCDMFYTPLKGRSETYTFIGTGHNVALAQQIAKTVIDIIHKSGKKEAAGSTPFLNSFRNAASQRISIRCTQLIEDAKKGDLKEIDEDGNDIGTGMVLASVYDNQIALIEKWKEEKGPSLKSTKSRARSTNSSGYSAGTAAGNRVGLRPTVSGKSNARLN